MNAEQRKKFEIKWGSQTHKMLFDKEGLMKFVESILAVPSDGNKLIGMIDALLEICKDPEIADGLMALRIEINKLKGEVK